MPSLIHRKGLLSGTSSHFAIFASYNKVYNQYA